ncbi:MAG: hypothetical protein IJ514_07415 [Clostridia bacterium]|nr:hypothetical protein [Clostridia bacterium]
MKKRIPLPVRITALVLGGILTLIGLVWVVEKFIFASFFFKGAKTEMAIPGLWSGFVPQGFEKVDEDFYLISGYDKTEGEPSTIYTVKEGERTGYKLYNADGSAYTSHAGGVTHFNGFVYIANDTGEDTTYCDMFLLSDLTDGDNKATKTDGIAIPNRLAYCSVYDGKLHVGAFYREGSQYLTPESHHLTTPCGDQNTALMLVYTLDEKTGKPVSDTPEHIYSTLSNVQGMCFTESGRMVLSTSWGLNPSYLYAYDLEEASTGSMQFNGAEVPVTYLDGDSLTQTVKCPPMSEELVYENGRVLILSESACMKYVFGKIMSGNFMRSFPIA